MCFFFYNDQEENCYIKCVFTFCLGKMKLWNWGFCLAVVLLCGINAKDFYAHLLKQRTLLHHCIIN